MCIRDRVFIEGVLCSRAPRESEFQELLLNGVIDIVLAELARDADSVFDGVGIGSAVAHDGNPLNSGQRCAAVLRIVEPALESAKCVLSEDGSNFRRKGAMQFLSKHRNERFEQSLTKFQSDVSRESVADNHIDITFEDIAAFNIADEVDGRLAKRLERLLREFVSL